MGLYARMAGTRLLKTMADFLPIPLSSDTLTKENIYANGVKVNSYYLLGNPNFGDIYLFNYKPPNASVKGVFISENSGMNIGFEYDDGYHTPPFYNPSIYPLSIAQEYSGRTLYITESSTGSFNEIVISGNTIFTDLNDAFAAFIQIKPYYPINYYHNAGCTITGRADAAPGQDVVVTVNVSSGYTFRGASGVTITDSYGARVPFIVNGNQVAFTMPQP